MDRNQSIGFLLMGLLLFGFFYFSSPQPNENAAVNTTEQNSKKELDEEAPAKVDEVSNATPEVVSDSQRVENLKDKYSDFWTLTEGQDDTVVVKTEKLTVKISKRGGNIASAYLNDYKTHDSLPLPIVSPDPNNLFYLQFGYKNRALNTKDFFFEPLGDGFSVEGENEKELVMRASLGEDSYLDQVYTFKGDKYDIGYKIRMKGLGDGLGKVSTYELKWRSHIAKTEYDIKNMRAKTGLVYRQGKDVEKITPTDEAKKENKLPLVEWVSFKSQFFSHILMADEPLSSVNLLMFTPENDEVARVMDAEMRVPINGSRDDIESSFDIYMGPNEYTTLVSYKKKLQQEMDLGYSILSWINKGTTYIFKFLEKYIDNYGFIIIILAFMIRMALLPLTWRSNVSMARMRVVNNTPEIKAIDEKHKDDPQKAMMAKQGIYREMGVNMLGGCLPQLLSLPFLFALFFFFPQSVELRQQSFLWAHDLSTYDTFFHWDTNIPVFGNHLSLFTILMAISTFVFTYFTQQSQPSTGANSQMKMIAYIMPVFLLVFLNSYAAGLSLYYLTSNLLNITQVTLIRNVFVKDEKLLAEMREKQKLAKKSKKGKGGKGGGGANKSRLERWVENQQKKQEAMMKERQKQSGNNRSTRRKK
ncbi:MAG: membrane protein insertase YidC [Bacteroidia bacterium]|nr:membrane protein insertase YidC [Bacteroidia bacterium]